MRALFGYHAAKAHLNIDFPSHLNALVKNLPPKVRPRASVEEWIDHHTLYGLVAPFRPQSATADLRKSMRVAGTGSTYASHLFGGDRASDALRYCPICVKENLESGREPYWRRTHQLRYVLVCPDHQVWLCDSSAKRSMLNRFPIVPARLVVRSDADVRLADPDDPQVAPLMWLAEDVKWLLDHPTLAPNSGTYADEHRFHMAVNDLGSYTGVQDRAKLLAKLESIYSAQVLTLIGMQTVGTPTGHWLWRVARGASSSPLAHLLFWRLLGLSAASFLAKVGECRPFEAGPWPCLNPTCPAYKMDVIETYEERIDARGQVFGHFRCPCGYMYSRKAIDRMGESRTEPHKILETGAIWDVTLTRYWQDGGLSVAEICRRLNSYHYPVRQAAERLGLPSKRGYRRRLLPPPNLQVEERKKSRETRQDECRRAVLEYCRYNPGLSRTELQRGAVRSEVNWLMRNDREWFEETAPPRRRSRAGGRTNRHEQRRAELDRELSCRIPDIRFELINRPGRPTRITKSAILSELGFHRSRLPFGNKLDLTIEAIDQATESLQDVALRRVAWLLDNARKEGRILRAKKVVWDARIRKAWLEEEEFAGALESLLGGSMGASPNSGEIS